MPSPAPDQVTHLLARAREGDPAAAAEAYDRLNAELREMAHRLFARELSGGTLQPTVLVNEAWLKMRSPDGQLAVPDLESRSAFIALAARVMRQILVDHAREKRAIKRGGGLVKLTLDDRDLAAASADADVLAVHEALERLEALRPRVARGVELRYFGGATIPETAAALGISPETVKNDWRFARAWLRKELQEDA